MTAPVLAAVERARRAWERTQPQTFLDLGILDEQPAPPRGGLFVEGAEPDAAADGGAGRLRASGRPVRTPDNNQRTPAPAPAWTAGARERAGGES